MNRFDDYRRQGVPGNPTMQELQAYDDERKEAEAIDWEALFKRVTGTVDAPINYEHLRVMMSENLNGHPGTIVSYGTEAGDLFKVSIRLGHMTQTYLFLCREEVEDSNEKSGFEINLNDYPDGANGEFVCKSELVDYLLEERELSLHSANGLPREFVERVVDYLHRFMGFAGTKHKTIVTYKTTVRSRHA